MKIEKNETRYSTRELRKIFTRVHNEIAQYEGRLPQWKRVRVLIRYARPGGVVWSGNGKIKGVTMKLRFQRGGIKIKDVAQAFGHELMHLYGYHNRNTRGMERRDKTNGGSFAPIDLWKYPGRLTEWDDGEAA
jgi:hypothetical protein